VWQSRVEVPALDLNDNEQLRLLTKVFSTFSAECATIPRETTDDPTEFFLENDLFGGTDALVLYCMIRHLRPNRIVEVGSGFSSRMATLALRQNGRGDLLCIEPFPDETLTREFSARGNLVEARVQDVPLSVFETLGKNDILFVDSSHVVRIGGDVTHIVLSVLPQLASGVVIHIHDVFLPDEMPRDWIEGELRFWNEQYLLQAFLAYNKSFEIIFGTHYLNKCYPEAMRATFPKSPWWGGGSFWIRKCD
jgi:hypothetical protein